MRLTEKVHRLLESSLRDGDRAIDATAGNGHDTLKLAELVGPDGEVVAIDLQAGALESTRKRLEHVDLADRVSLREGCHEEVLQTIAETGGGVYRAIVFNLGYLPGSDKSTITRPSSTTAALAASTTLLKSKGLLLVTAYRGHPGGIEEAEAVSSFMESLRADGWQVDCNDPDSEHGSPPPVLWTAVKSGD